MSDELKLGLLIGILHNHGVPATIAWSVPVQLKQRLQDEYNLNFTIDDMSTLSIEQLTYIYKHPTNIHRFNNKMAIYTHANLQLLTNQYQSNLDLLYSKDNHQLIENIAHLSGMSEKKARHLQFYLAKLNQDYSIDDCQIEQIRTECSTLLENYQRNIDILLQIDA